MAGVARDSFDRTDNGSGKAAASVQHLVISKKSYIDAVQISDYVDTGIPAEPHCQFAKAVRLLFITRPGQRVPLT
ncbi:hypothetical protein LMG28614_03735 [Paraburkholderia ultramafica]|uniref:Uncharacterized protein n=1 Tax=Paraburkholderia ultramafica TaxID=1544867 RepID=A0A6S7BMJ7_9BURK|nr:hypothetical protein LMG28614_03735 [Paraburkholderia ultramafica]